MDNPTDTPGTVAVGMPTPDALALLPIPETLSDAQRDGHVCVWGGETLTANTAIDLGSRKADDRLIFPRACRRDTGTAAWHLLLDHSSKCEQCVDNAANCELGRALLRLMREGRRP